jgi:23S rRNA (cytidine2498-2'-O)-methyltransferase
MNNPLVTFIKRDAFKIAPRDIGNVDWVFCDAACYPRRLLEWLHLWTDGSAQLPAYMVCTVKLQGEPDWDALGEFEKIKGSALAHLNYNKHELTWLFSSKHALSPLRMKNQENICDFPRDLA